MKVWICNNLAHFLGPQQGPARLYAYLKKQGYDIQYKDFNQDAYFTLLSREYLGQTFDRLRSVIDSAKRSKFLRENIGSILIHSSNRTMKQLLAKGIVMDGRWRGFVKTSGIVKRPLMGIIKSRVNQDNIFYALISQRDFVLSEIDRANSILDKEFLGLRPEAFISNFCTLLCGKAIIDAAHFPAQLDFGLGFHGTAYNPCASDIMRAVDDEKRNFLLPYFRRKVAPQISQEQPDVIGISITHPSEFVPAFTLANLIKSGHPEAHICLGGAAVTEIAYRIVKNPPLWNLFDSLIIGPGEYAFGELINALGNGRDLSKVPNLIYKERDAIRKSEKVHEFDINEACTPEYVGLRPRSGVPLETASGCYWGKCIFCCYPKQGTANLNARQQVRRIRNIELVLEDFRKLRDTYDPIYIGITDSSMHPGRLMRISEQNIQSGKKVNFSAFIRFETDFKSTDFCQKLAAGGFLGGQVGLESGSQRVNNIINKGVDLEDAVVIIKNLYKAGVLIHLYTLTGLPGERMEDAEMTYKFLKRWHRRITLNWQVYSVYMLEHSPLAMRAEEFGIKATPLPDDYLVQAMKYTIGQELSQETSAAVTIRFNEKLKRYLHPLNNIMDIELVKLFLLAQKANGIAPDKIKKISMQV
jgi:anaerobic magnesium-protoporphyrin IX monomethyl ester cyclase